uniref:ORF035 n=1 Tax=Spodoptera frugiperda granulovirus TaxID=307454 RepID=A0A346QVV4_9BBAC|nr:ORF035 [Spodoptera frugiperda granulovirus]
MKKNTYLERFKFVPSYWSESESEEENEAQEEEDNTSLVSISFRAADDEYISSCSDSEADAHTKKCRRWHYQTPYTVIRYTPYLRLLLVRDFGRRHVNQYESVVTMNTLQVNRTFCMCTDPLASKSRAHLINTLNHIRYVFSRRRFMNILISFFYLFFMGNRTRVRLAKNPNPDVNVCDKCYMVDWWMRAFDDDPLDLAMFIYETYVLRYEYKQGSGYKYIFEFMLKVQPVSFVVNYVNITFKYIMNQNKTNQMWMMRRFRRKLYLMLYDNGAKWYTTTGTTCKNNLILYLYVWFNKRPQFQDFVTLLNNVLVSESPSTLSGAIYLKMLRTGLNETQTMFNQIPVQMKWNEELARELIEKKLKL